MCCVAPLNRRPQRRLLRASSCLSALAVVLLLWLYLYLYGYGPASSYESWLPGSLLPASKERDAGNAAPAETAVTTAAATSSTTTTTTTTTHTMPGAKASPPSASAPAVTLRQGTYVGTTLLASSRFPKAVEAFRGVPYAQSTAGQNRFRPPQPLPKSSETFDAVAWGQVCPADGAVRPGSGEDCLNANIYRPAGLVLDKDGYYEKAEGGGQNRPRLPVVVYVHGGGFNTGQGPERNMATFVAWAEAPMVAVNFNYRVGALGFLPSDVTAREGLLNLGLRDQQMLLEWVRDNIEAFGGDPENVTIMGLSAGAHSIGHHIMYYSRSPTSAPFAKAILESGATTARAVFYPTHPRHLVQFREFLIAAGAEGVPESDIFAHLRTLPLETIVRASKAVWDKYVASVTWPFQPVIDGPNPFANSSHRRPGHLPPIIPDLPIKSWLAGAHVRIPILTGYNTNEGTLFIPPHADTNAQFRSFFQTLIPSLPAADLDALEALYPDPTTANTTTTNSSSPHPSSLSPSNNSTNHTNHTTARNNSSDNNNHPSPTATIEPGLGRQWARLDAAYSHYAYVCPVLQTAHYMTTARSAAGGVPPNVYVYRYAATALWGAANHGDEAPLVAHDLEGGPLRGLPGLEAVARAMHGLWVRFVVSKTGELRRRRRVGGGDGDEDGVEELEWPVFVSPFGGEGAGKIMVFGEGNDERSGGSNRGVPAKVEQLTKLERKACRFWWERVFLSEGLGRREEGGKKKARARL